MMDRYRPHHHINDPEAAPSSYPLYPAAEDVLNKEKNEGDIKSDNNIETAGPVSKISEWREKEYDPPPCQSLSK